MSELDNIEARALRRLTEEVRKPGASPSAARRDDDFLRDLFGF